MAAGRHTDPLLRVVALPVPSCRLPLRRARPPQCRARLHRPRVRARRYRCPRRGPVLRRRRAAREVLTRGHLHDGDRDEPRPGSGAAASGAPAVVPQHLVVGSRRPDAGAVPRCPSRARRWRPRPGAGPTRLARHVPPLRGALDHRELGPTRRADPAVLRQRDQRRGAVWHRGAQRIPQGRCEPGRGARRPCSHQPGRPRHEGRPPLRLRPGGSGGERHGAAAAQGWTGAGPALRPRLRRRPGPTGAGGGGVL